MENKAVLAPAKGAWRASGRDPADELWHLFSSPKLALLLLLGIAAASLLGSLIMQVPEAIRQNPVDYLQWLGRAEGKYGSFWTKLFHWAQIFFVFGSFWFKSLLILLLTNIVVCSINRWRTIWHGLTFRRVVMAPAFYHAGGHTFAQSYRSAQVPPELALRSLVHILVRSRYRILTEEDHNGAAYLYADRYRFSRLGTYATHLSIILLLAGALAEGLGFRDEDFIVSETATREVGHDTGLALYLDDFTDEWYLNDTPKDYRSDVVLFENGQEVERRTIRVNEPLSYKGVRFHQAFYGTAVVMEVRDSSGNLSFSEPVALPWRTRAATKDGEGRPLGTFNLPEQGLSVYLVLTSGPLDRVVLPGQVLVEVYASAALGQPLLAELLDLKQPTLLGDLEFTFVRERQFSGLQVVRAPGMPLIWVASFLLIGGNVVVLFFPLRQLWARSYLKETDETAVEVRALATRDHDLDGELQRLRQGMAALVPAPTVVEGGPAPSARRVPVQAVAPSVATRGEGRKRRQ